MVEDWMITTVMRLLLVPANQVDYTDQLQNYTKLHL